MSGGGYRDWGNITDKEKIVANCMFHLYRVISGLLDNKECWELGKSNSFDYIDYWHRVMKARGNIK